MPHATMAAAAHNLLSLMPFVFDSGLFGTRIAFAFAPVWAALATRGLGPFHTVTGTHLSPRPFSSPPLTAELQCAGFSVLA